MVFIVVDIAVEESFGLIKASRVLRDCGVDPKNMRIDTFYNTIRIIVNDVSKIQCVSKVKGYATLEIRSVFRCENIENVFAKAGFVKAPKAFQRIVGYIPTNDGTVIIQRTSKRDVYLAKACTARRIELPLPSSACIIAVNSDADLEKAKKIAVYLNQLEKMLENLCQSASTSGVDNQ
ncbi:MAG: hypothetical protein QW348_02275 [Ignisphaera sp.]